MNTEPQTPSSLSEESPVKKRIWFEDGKMYFDRKTEREFYFVLTMGILILLFLTKTGFLNG